MVGSLVSATRRVALEVRARSILNCAVRKGLVKRPSKCTRCNTSDYRREGHHPDYDRALDVEWLCQSCHTILHRSKPLLDFEGMQQLYHRIHPRSHRATGELPVREEAAV